MHKLIKVALYMLAIMGFPLFLLVTNPNNLPLVGMVLPFILLFITVFMTVRTLIVAFMSVSHKFVVTLSLIAALTVLLLAVFQSLHQLNARDVLIIIGFDIGLLFYVGRLYSAPAG